MAPIDSSSSFSCQVTEVRPTILKGHISGEKGGLINKSAKWHCGRHTLRKILIKKT